MRLSEIITETTPEVAKPDANSTDIQIEIAMKGGIITTINKMVANRFI